MACNRCRVKLPKNQTGGATLTALYRKTKADVERQNLEKQEKQRREAKATREAIEAKRRSENTKQFRGGRDRIRVFPNASLIGGHPFDEILANDQENSFKPVIEQMLILNGIKSFPESTINEVVECGLDDRRGVCDIALPMAVYKATSQDFKDRGVKYNCHRLMKYIKSNEFQSTPEYRYLFKRLHDQLDMAYENLCDGRDILDGIEDMMGGNIFPRITGRASNDL